MDRLEGGGRAIDLGGTLRVDEVANSLVRAREVMRDFGITRLANVTGLDHVGVPTWMAVRPLARSLSVSQGKGLTHDLARISALMECIELHHAEHFVPAGHLQSLGVAAEDPRYVDPLLLPIHPSAKIDDASAVEWIEGYDILARRARWVPRDCMDVDTTSVSEPKKRFLSFLPIHLFLKRTLMELLITWLMSLRYSIPVETGSRSRSIRKHR